MRVFAIFSSPSDLTGSTLNLGFCIKSLAAAGHSVTVLCRSRDTASAHLEQCGAELIFFNLPLAMNTTAILESLRPSLLHTVVQNAKDLLRLSVGFPLTCRYLARLKPDVLFLSDIVFPQCALAARLMRVPVIVEAQALLIQGRRGIRRRMLTALWRRSEAIFGITSQHVAPFAEPGGRAQVSVIPNTVAPAAEGIRPPPHPPVLSFFGGVNPLKGCPFLLTLLPPLLRKHPDLKVILAGSFNRSFRSPHGAGNLRGLQQETAHLFDFVRTHSLTDHVEIVGLRTDVAALMAASDIVLVPNHVPHFARPVLEAFAAGAAVVASDDVFNRDLIIDGDNGFLAPYGDTDAWLARIERLIADRPFAETLKNRGYETYQSRFSPDPVARQIVNVFEGVMRAAPADAGPANVPRPSQP